MVVHSFVCKRKGKGNFNQWPEFYSMRQFYRRSFKEQIFIIPFSVYLNFGLCFTENFYLISFCQIIVLKRQYMPLYSKNDRKVYDINDFFASSPNIFHSMLFRLNCSCEKMRPLDWVIRYCVGKDVLRLRRVSGAQQVRDRSFPEFSVSLYPASYHSLPFNI